MAVLIYRLVTPMTWQRISPTIREDSADRVSPAIVPMMGF